MTLASPCKIETHTTRKETKEHSSPNGFPTPMSADVPPPRPNRDGTPQRAQHAPSAHPNVCRYMPSAAAHMPCVQCAPHIDATAEQDALTHHAENKANTYTTPRDHQQRAAEGSTSLTSTTDALQEPSTPKRNAQMSQEEQPPRYTHHPNHNPVPPPSPVLAYL